MMKTAFILRKIPKKRHLLNKMLADLGIKSMFFDTWDELGRALFEKCPDVVLMDWEFNGQSTLGFVQKNAALFPCVFLSECDDVCKMKEAVDAGVAEYIIKPFDSAILKSKLQMCDVIEE